MSFKIIGLFNRKVFSNSRFLFLMIIVILSILFAMTWYSNKISYVINRASKHNQDYIIQIDGFNAFTKNNFEIYLLRYKNVLLLKFHDFIIYGFLLYLFIRKDKYKWLFLSSILISYLTFTLVPWKTTRYIIPLIPLFVIGLCSLIFLPIELISKNKNIQKILFNFITIVITFILLVSYFKINYSNTNIRPFTPNSLFSEGLYRPHNINYEINQIISQINNGSNVLILPNSDLFDAIYHEFKFKKLNHNIDRGYFCIGSGGSNNCHPNSFSIYSNKSYICSFDYIIDYKEDFDYHRYGVVFQPENSTIHKEVLEPLIKNWNECGESQFSLIKEFYNKSDSSRRHIVTIQIYKKNEI